MGAEPRTRFAVDRMLIKLGKYLRILGYDAVWPADERTHDLIRRANREGRVFCTRNTHLDHQFPHPETVLLLARTDPVDQLWDLIHACSLDPGRFLFTRCIRCNRPLEDVTDKTAIRDAVHPNVFTRHRRFYRCPACGTIFWHGSHVRNTCRKLGLTPPPEA